MGRLVRSGEMRVRKNETENMCGNINVEAGRL